MAIIIISFILCCFAQGDQAQQQGASSGEKLVEQNQPFSAWMKAFMATLLVSTVPLLLLFFVPYFVAEEGRTSMMNSDSLKTLVSFAVGGLLGDVFIHLLPHAFAASLSSHPNEEGSHQDQNEPQSSDETHDHGSENRLGLWILLGMLLFFVVEKYARAYHNGIHGHSHSHDIETEKESNKKNKKQEFMVGDTQVKVGGLLNLVADCTHNFTDGMAIAASFLISEKVGISTTIAVLIHEIPHEIGDYAILVQSGFSTQKAMALQLVTAIGAFLGTFVGLATGGQGGESWVLPFTAGGFIYISTVDIIPELLEKADFKQSVKEIAAMCFGVGMMVLISHLE